MPRRSRSPLIQSGSRIATCWSSSSWSTEQTLTNVSSAPAIAPKIFYTSDEQRKVAEQTISDVDASGHWPGKIVTKISDAGPFWEAEAGDQDYFQRYPDGCTPPFPRAGVEAANRETATSSSESEPLHLQAG